MNTSSRQNWIAVASADHARRGRDEMTPGFMQVGHGKLAPRLDAFEFIEDRSRWGYKFRFGLFSISNDDMALIAKAMQIDTELLQFSEQSRQENMLLQMDLL
jgi:hypothetical protein